MAVDNVLRWEDEIHTQLKRFALGDLLHPADLLALIHIESAGDPYARRPGSQFYGLLQIGRPYFKDAMEWAEHDADDQSVLDGDGATSIAITLAYLCRYAAFHQWHPTLVATIHKGGVGTCRMVRNDIISGTPTHEALEKAERSLGVPRLREYVRRFEEARASYGKRLIESVRPDRCVDMGSP